MPNHNPNQVAIVLTGGGARSAYHLGVLKYIFDTMDARMEPPIFIGSSAGAINATYLVQHAHEGFKKAIHDLCDIWCSLKVERIYKTDIFAVSRVVWHFLRNITIGRFTEQRIIESLLDSAPMYALLRAMVDIKSLHHNIDTGLVRGLGITATQYGTGRSLTFFQTAPGHKVGEWNFPRRQGLETKIMLKHIMASAAIPFLFPSVKIGENYYGDGSIRFTAPFSPAIHLGASKLLAVGMRKIDPNQSEPAKSYPSIAQIGGTLLNAIFLDTLDYDARTLTRINELLKNQKDPMSEKPIDLALIQPSSDLGICALKYNKYLSKTLKFLMNSVGSTQRGGADLLSYLLFDHHYIEELIHLGYEDAKLHHKDLLTIFPPHSVAA
ncbi:MAG TPA: patatin-like phospholipase family protein [Bdellovibrionota bacterium]|nr:patatin-like phospholipase family protein [Bdellovibrionota bacterium]